VFLKILFLTNLLLEIEIGVVIYLLIAK